MRRNKDVQSESLDATKCAVASMIMDEDTFDMSYVNQVEVEGNTSFAAEYVLARMIKDKTGRSL